MSPLSCSFAPRVFPPPRSCPTPTRSRGTRRPTRDSCTPRCGRDSRGWPWPRRPTPPRPTGRRRRYFMSKLTTTWRHFESIFICIDDSLGLFHRRRHPCSRVGRRLLRHRRRRDRCRGRRAKRQHCLKRSGRRRVPFDFTSHIQIKTMLIHVDLCPQDM